MDIETLKEMDRKYLFQNYGRVDIAFSHGRAEFLYDLHGREYIDLVAGIAVNSLGYSHPAMISAICEQASRLIHVSNLYRIKEQVELAEALCAISPNGLDKALFVNSGAEANEAALKLAIRHTKRDKVVAIQNSFHGRTAAALKVTGQSKYQEGFSPLLGDFADYIPLNDVEALKSAIGSKTAAVILEPIQGEGGIRPCKSEFFHTARDLCDEKGALMIVDEVQTGIGRTGEWFGFQHFGVVPDIISLAKGLGGGFPIGCILSSEEISKSFTPGSHGTTFGGSPLASAAALSVIRTIQSENLVERARIAGEKMIETLKASIGGPVIDVRGKGFMIGIEMPGHAKELQTFAMERGILINVCAENVVRLVPPLVISDSSLQKFLDTFNYYMEII